MTQQPDKFTRRDVERSFRKFHDIVNDLMTATSQTWGDTFKRLVAHCETDTVMQVITEPLKTDSRIDANQWWNDAINSARGMAGSGQPKLPADDDERTALLYQVFLKLEHEDIDIGGFCLAVYGARKRQDMADTFNRELVQKFTREVCHRLDEITTDTADQQEIAREAMVVFHHYDYSTYITGNVQGSNIATGSAQITNSTAQFNTPADVAAELRALKSLASEYSKTNQATITQALDFLADAAESENAAVDEIAENARTIAEISPPISSRLNGLVSGARASLIGSAIMEGLKLVFGG